MVRSSRWLAGVALVAFAGMGFSAEKDNGLKVGTAELKSAGTLAFGPDSILFVADTAGKSIFAIDTGDTKTGNTVSKIEKLDEQIASALGVTADQVIINDLKVNPATGRVFLSVARGKGPDAMPAIIKIGDDGKPVALDLKKIGNASVKIGDSNLKKQVVVTGLAFVKGSVVVSGVTSEEWDSSLQSIPFPFTSGNKGVGVEIFHGAHGKFETKAPIRTFAAYDIAGQTHLLASYQCTPLVKISLDSIKAGEKVKGKTVAELGNRNLPLDIIIYTQASKDYALIANTTRGVMKVSLEGIDKIDEITARVNGETAGLKYDKIKDLEGTVQMDKASGDKVVVLRKADKNYNLEIVPLP
ncbi:hypothetical protein [Zavarzinella formosa]|uniref:hypothetical protein n=1 Tax=Zavarzinella formosa TaxID=360055 RepID=UPI000374F388|nr:hypothetical protein [Zavarzinella formosa]